MKLLCLNIDNGPEWELAKQQFDAFGLEVERFQATVEDNRPLAFNKSVYAALSTMPEGGWLFEDDVMFEGSLSMVKEALRVTPSDMLTFSMGCNIIGTDTIQWRMPEHAAPGVVRVYNAWQTHANYYSAECVQYILNNLNPMVLDERNMIFDEWLRTNILSEGRSYLMSPMVAYQRPRWSEIWNRDANYTGAHLQGNRWLLNNI